MDRTVRLEAGVHHGNKFERVRFPTDEILLRVTTGGNVQVVEYTSEDREGPPAHAHEWDEIEYVIEGNVEFFLGGKWTAAGPGTVQTLPAGAAHSVRVPSGKARVLLVTIGAPYAGFARDIAGLHEAGDPSPADVVATAARHGVRLA